MGLSIALEDESGNELGRIEDTANILHRVLPKPGKAVAHSLLQFVDWYGDAVFNHLQMKPLLQELDGLKRSAFARFPESAGLFAQMKHLARRCQKETHCYLKFYGD